MADGALGRFPRHKNENMPGTKQILETAAPLVPAHGTLVEVREAAAHCKACPLWERGTQTVFGEGSAHARMMLVGEQPGNDEDLAGHPFIGPAGKLLDRALAEAGIDRKLTWVTNTVKHFKWEPRGKRRIHAKPSSLEITACLPWLRAELSLVKPKVLVCLGATAAQALLGKQFRITRDRGVLVQSPLAPHVMATIHPSAILRAIDDETRALEMQRFIDDLKVVAPLLKAA
jgi:uracil-DNA glycosylase family protein